MTMLDMAIREAGACAYVAYGSSADANTRYLTRLQITDPVVFIKKPGERGRLIVPQMEYERAVRESAAAVVTRSAAGFFEYITAGESRLRATAHMIAAQAGGAVLVPEQFPLGLAREIESFAPVLLDAGTVESMRAVKSADEIEAIRSVQRATEAAMDHALTLIRNARSKGGILYHGDAPLTSEAVRAGMHRLLLDHGCRGTDTIVACGADTALPHHVGSGPLAAGEPIIIDIFPQDEQTGYHADMTRTVVKGEPSPEIREMYEAVRDAQQMASQRIMPGVSGADLYQEVVDFFRERGYATDTQGFVHSLGHGVGLDVHEQPFLGLTGEALAAGNVVTVEPGLYYTGIGGVRLEDMGAVSPGGFDRFTRYPMELQL
ncbi:aminopeptidase P family protein [Methanoculleus sp. FWC-SCC1]|uniref:Aminopeptidase P family protein n=1 Tax=Methanoculleus frigidifontis TaxID=2584085 RepID=A0ABT8MAN0_9EURY|nr:Xaa-Pro peptidase family protein [Methanoculleus sp. FWC-SCC1]MDN7024946.1 aminopeptidase P family protein [Methanoculleus sp. FWC-SCC1]